MAALAVLTFGCGAEVVQVELPDVPGTRAMLVGVRYEGRLTLYAIDREAAPDTSALPGIAALKTDARLVALLYPETLAELDWRPGPLIEDPDGALPPEPAGGRFELTVAGGRAGAWEKVAAASSELTFRLPVRPPDRSHCVGLQATVRSMPGPGRVLVALPEPEGGVLAVDVFGDAFRITEAEIEPLGPTGVPAVFAGVRTATGAIWLSGYGGALWSGTLQGGFQPVVGPPRSETIRWLAVPPTLDTPAELFTLSRTGTLARRAGGQWRKTVLIPSLGSDHQGDLTWLGPDSVAAVSPLTGVLSLVSAGVADHIGIHITQGTLWDVARLDGLLYGLTDHGLVVRFVGLDFTQEAFIPEATSSNTVTAFAGGLLVTARGLRLFHHIPGKLPCPVMGPQDVDHEIWTAVAAGDAVYLFTGNPSEWDSEPARVVVVRVAPG